MSAREYDDQQTPAEGNAETFPCTLLQERLWAEHKKDAPQGLNVAMRWRLSGNLSHSAIEAAFQLIVQRHEILRTRFNKVDGKLCQVVLPTCPFKLRAIDLSFLPAGDSAERADEIARAEALEPIDPAQAPLLRATLLRFTPDRGVLLITFDSMVVDGWSIGLIVRELRAAVVSIEAGVAPDLPEPELQFADYALWESQLLTGGALDEERAFWQRQLENAVGTRVEPDHRLDVHESERSQIMSILLPEALSRAAEAFGRERSITLYGLASAALALMLHRVTGDSQIVFGSQVANRGDPLAETLVGPTVNSVTLCLPVDDSADPHAFIKAVADRVQETLQHQRLPFEIAAGFAPNHHDRPLHSINLVVHRSYSGIAETEQAGADRFNLLSLPSFSSGTSWDLNFFLIGRDEGWRMSCEGKPGLYDQETVRGLIQAWRLCLETLVTAVDCRLSDCAALQEIPARSGRGHGLQASPAAERQQPIPVHDPARQVLRFHEGGSKVPMIVLNNRSVYFQLARHLGEHRPFTDIVLYHADGPIDLQPYTFEDFATYAVRLIRWVQPRGPYILGGHCVYGVMAFEAARQLQRMGEEVALVALFDSWAPGYRETMSPRDQALRKLQLRRYGYALKLKQFRNGEIGLNEIVKKPILSRLGLLGPQPEPEEKKLPGRWFDEYVYEAVKHYRPGPYEGDALLFRSNEPLHGRLFEERMGWGPLMAGNFRKVDVDSAHLDMFRERPAADIATSLREALGEQEGH